MTGCLSTCGWMGIRVRTQELEVLENAGFPVVRLQIKDREDLGGQFYLWEMATAIAGWRLAIQPFDQPNVESAKILARQMMAAYQEEGSLPAEDPKIFTEKIQVYGGPEASDPTAALLAFLEPKAPAEPSGAALRGYAAIQAYVNPVPEVLTALGELRLLIRDRFKLATTLGIGPRFLHSTGQLHKGDAGLGLFIQITSDPMTTSQSPIRQAWPNSAVTFGVLLSAQAMGDRQALLEAGRQVIRFHIREDLTCGSQGIDEGVEGKLRACNPRTSSIDRCIQGDPVTTHGSDSQLWRHEMQLAMIGLGKMGGNMARKLARGGHTGCRLQPDRRSSG